MRESEPAAWPMRSLTFVMAGLPPIILSSMNRLSRRLLFSRRRSSMARAFLTTVMVLSSESGFSRKSKAPILTACTARVMLAWPEIMMTSMSGCSSRSFFSTSMPPMRGSHTSRNTRSTGRSPSSASPAMPSSAASTV